MSTAFEKFFEDLKVGELKQLKRRVDFDEENLDDLELLTAAYAIAQVRLNPGTQPNWDAADDFKPAELADKMVESLGVLNFKDDETVEEAGKVETPVPEKKKLPGTKQTSA